MARSSILAPESGAKVSYLELVRGIKKSISLSFLLREHKDGNFERELNCRRLATIDIQGSLSIMAFFATSQLAFSNQLNLTLDIQPEN